MKSCNHLPLLDRINRVIDTKDLAKTLEVTECTVPEFQARWPKYKTFDDLPWNFRAAIFNGEHERYEQGRQFYLKTCIDESRSIGSTPIFKELSWDKQEVWIMRAVLKEWDDQIKSDRRGVKT